MRCRDLSRVRVRVDFQDWVSSLDFDHVAIAKVDTPAGRLGRLRISALGSRAAECEAAEVDGEGAPAAAECAATPLGSEIHYGALALFGAQEPK